MCRLLSAATVAALTAAIVPGLAAAADGGSNLLLRGGPVAAYAGPQTNGRADPLDTALASAPNRAAPVTTQGAVRLACKATLGAADVRDARPTARQGLAILACQKHSSPGDRLDLKRDALTSLGPCGRPGSSR
jgi:hypothetical protein